MAANGISTLATKELRQLAKLTLAQTKRKAGGVTTAPAYRVGNNFSVLLLAAHYVGNVSVPNNNPGLAIGRPWTTAPAIVPGAFNGGYSNGFFGGGGSGGPPPIPRGFTTGFNAGFG